MASIFTKIVRGEIPCHRVYEDDRHLAFLDIRPFVEGHTLVIPKREVDWIFDLEEAELAALWVAARKVARHLQERLARRVCVGVWGFEVRHAHVHLIPCATMRDFPPPPPKAADAETLAKLAARLRF